MKAEIIKRPNRLKAKVCGSEHVAGGTFAGELLVQAQDVVAEFAEKYAEQADIDISKLLAAASAVMMSPNACGERIERLRLDAREIMGQAETFGFLLLGQFARSLYDMCEGVECLSQQQSALIQAHIDAMALIVRSRIVGDGGAIGRELLRSLALAKMKFATANG